MYVLSIVMVAGCITAVARTKGSTPEVKVPGEEPAAVVSGEDTEHAGADSGADRAPAREENETAVETTEAEERTEAAEVAEEAEAGGQAEADGSTTILFTGDVLFANAFKAGYDADGIKGVVAPELLEELRAADILMVNNEFPFSDRGTPMADKQFTFRCSPGYVKALNEMGVDIVSVANNHIYDYGEISLLDTLDTLQQDGIPYAGAGRNLEEAAAPVYFISGGMKIGFLSATQIERLDNPDTKGAIEGAAGVFRCWNPEKLLAVTEETRKNCDFLVVYIHWGTENVAEADWAQLDQAPKIAQAGADLIIGDHPHCLQGIQYFGETPVFYSLGNFWFNSKTLDTCLLKVTLTDSRIESMTFIPAVQSGCYTSLAEGEEGQRVISYMNSLSTGVFIGSDGSISRQE